MSRAAEKSALVASLLGDKDHWASDLIRAGCGGWRRVAIHHPSEFLMRRILSQRADGLSLHFHRNALAGESDLLQIYTQLGTAVLEGE